MPSPTAECPECAGRPHFITSRQTAVLVSLLILAALFLLAGLLTQRFRQHREELAREWYSRGEAELKAGRAEAALNPLRTALVYSRDNPQYELRLAQALVAGQHYAEAQTYLLTLWERQPGSSTLNLELARLAARRGEVGEAIRYYQASIYGVWESAGAQHRRAARLELIAYLADHGRKAEALAETIEFAANLPSDAALHVQAGELFLKQNSDDHALEQFREALQMEPRNVDALAGAGRAAFESGDYSNAARFLERAVRAVPGDSSSAELLSLVRAVLSLDPDAPGLSGTERMERAQRAFALARARLAVCPAARGGEYAQLFREVAEHGNALEPKLKRRRQVWDEELRTALMEFARKAEAVVFPECGSGSVDDRAVLLLATRASGGVVR